MLSRWEMHEAGVRLARFQVVAVLPAWASSYHDEQASLPSSLAVLYFQLNIL